MERRIRKTAVCLLAMIAVALLCNAALAQDVPTQDFGATALAQMFPRLRTTARLLHTTAHPDDDDGSMLVYIARGRGVRTVMQTLNRGEGGQNKFGAELFDELGVLRTLELMEADRFYGVEQRFTRVVDFGFSKNGDETFQKWGGHDPALADIVREIRRFRPDVIVSRFDGSGRDGHGNHQATGILSREAFKAAADPARFPEQIREGLLPWQAKKLYIGNTPQNEATLKLNVGAYDPVLGMSYAQYSVEGLKYQASQGVGGFNAAPGDIFRNYKLAESTVGQRQAEGDFFDGIDVTLPGLAARLGSDESKAPFLRPALTQADKLVEQAAVAFRPNDTAAIAPALVAALQQLRDAARQIEPLQIAPAAKAEVLSELQEKQRQFAEAINLALGTTLLASADSPNPQTGFGFFRQEETFRFAVPGQTFTATARLYNRSKLPIEVRDIQLVAPIGWKIEKLKAEGAKLEANQQASAQFRVTVPADAQYTRPYWHRDDPREAVYKIDQPQYATMALPPWPLYARATYALGDGESEIESVVQTKYVDPANGQTQRPLAVAPPVSVSLEPALQVISTHLTGTAEVVVGVRNNVNGAAQANVKLQAPPGWRVAPASQPAQFASGGEYKDFRFTVTPPALKEGAYDLNAVVDYDGKSYSEGFTTIGHHDIGEFNYYRPSRQRISAVEVNVPKGIQVGYIMGAGDDIPAVLQQVGVNLHMITPAELASSDLSRFHTIVVGIRAYDVRTDIRQFNRRLLEYVSNGGTLLVQYVAATGAFNNGHYSPFPMTLSNERVTVEEAPVSILDAANPIFHTPNRITGRDFDGWVQERGLYFAGQWDAQFKPLLESHDPGEPPRQGGLLVAHYGKGLYIYTGYAFFRQVPAGLPGAVRLFVNLVSASSAPVDKAAH
jgi:LmbE family N-acetylglucosaminyl deacetylase